MNPKVLNTLEYPKIIDRLVSHASSPAGKRLCRELRPMPSRADIEGAQIQTGDALTRLFKKGQISFSGARDMGPSLKRLEVGASLSIEELLHLASLLEAVARVKNYSRRENEDVPTDSLDDMFSLLEPLTPVSSEIRRCILSEEDISDNASANLQKIRRRMKDTAGRVHTELTRMVNGSCRTYLQDAVITMRNDRYCIPVKAEYKNQVPGMIHDQSSTGSTLFIEPAAVVKLNNDLKELAMEEAREIEAIIGDLSALAGEHAELISLDCQLMGDLDFIFARGKLAMEQNATAPVLNTQGRIHIRKGRHPLLDPKSVVPIDVRLGEDFDLLVVTGPNTGGKTVSLKTVGLLTLMGLSGLHIPALDRSELSVFTEVFADIGDEQSIEQSLSTFSSHMTKIVSILKNADADSLCLFDELGAGTDPTEGAALAISILSHLHERGIRTMATTHYSELKVFALTTEGVENGCQEFDVETLRPTYRLLIGIPGKSNAFAISSKLGLPDFIIEDARSRIGEQDLSFEDLLSDLEESRVTIERERLEINQYKTEIRQLKEKLEQKQEKLEGSRDKILRDASEKARDVLQEAKDYADSIIRDFQKYEKGGGSIKEMEQKRQKLREKIDKSQKYAPPLSPGGTKPQKELKASDLRLGDTVKVLSLGVKGTVSSLPDHKGNLFVQCGILRSQTNLKDLVLLDEPSVTGPGFSGSSSGKIKMGKSASVSPELNLLGCTVDEALSRLDKYLDDAYLAHLSPVRIVHGKGTGALRAAVHSHLKRVKYVKEFHLGAFGEGDAGVTIVEFN